MTPGLYWLVYGSARGLVLVGHDFLMQSSAEDWDSMTVNPAKDGLALAKLLDAGIEIHYTPANGGKIGIVIGLNMSDANYALKDMVPDDVRLQMRRLTAETVHGLIPPIDPPRRPTA